jgi:hypothetical protein
MPEGAAPRSEHDFSRHDGILVDLQLAGFAGGPHEILSGGLIEAEASTFTLAELQP